MDNGAFLEILIHSEILRKIDGNPAEPLGIFGLRQIRSKYRVVLFVAGSVHVGHVVGNNVHLLPQSHLTRQGYVFRIIHYILPNRLDNFFR